MREETPQQQEELELLRDSEWQRAQAGLQRLREIGAAMYFRTELEGIRHAFEPIEKVLACIDEGVEKRTFRMAGSGILMPIGDIVEYIRVNGIQGLYTHAGCGAAALAAKQEGWDGDPDEYAKEWAKKVSTAAGITYIGHIDMSELSRPMEFHDATCAYYIGGDRFSAAGVKKLPRGFHAHRKLGKEILSSLQLAVDIAMGDHGFGSDRFFVHPFRIIVVGNPNDDHRNFAALLKEVTPILLKYPGRVVVDGLDLDDEMIAHNPIAA